MDRAVIKSGERSEMTKVLPAIKRVYVNQSSNVQFAVFIKKSFIPPALNYCTHVLMKMK